ERMNDEDLARWVLARMRGEQEDPPLSSARLEARFDFVCVAHQVSEDRAFQTRLEAVVLHALSTVGLGDLRAELDRRALRALSFLADALDLRDAAPKLAAVAERGA